MQTSLISNAAGFRVSAKLVINVTPYGYGPGSPAAGETFNSILVTAKKAAPEGRLFRTLLLFILDSCELHPSHRPRRYELIP